MNFFIKAYILKNCYYSNNSKNILSKLKNIKIINVPSEKSKDECKKETNMFTFPQIILVHNNDEYIIGGNDNLEYLLSIKNDVKNNLKQLKEYFNSIKENINIKNYNVFLMTLIILYS